MDFRRRRVAGGSFWWGVGILAAVPNVAMAERVVYLNADPTVLVNTGGQDPTLNSYDTAGFMPGAISGWPGLTDAQKVELEYILKEATVPFDIVFTWERPAVGPYDMVVMGTMADNAALFPTVGCSGAIGLADCGDTNGDNVSFLFYGCMPAAQQTDMSRVAFTLLTGAGFGWGLENLTAVGQIGGSYTANGVRFGNACVAVSDGQCTDHVGCAAGQQNSTADLTARIGARVDDGPPVVTITSPTTMSDVEASFDVTADITDAFGGLTVTLDIVEAAQELSDPEPPYEWSLSGVPAGMWTLQVIAVDADGNESSQEVTVCVDVPDCGGAPAGTGSSGTGDTAGADESTDGGFFGSSGLVDWSTTGGSDDDDDGATGDPIDPSVPAEPTGFGGEAADTGCSCGSTPGKNAASWLLGLGLLALARGRGRVTRGG
jgi:hypothetical protein